jgi:hypothetical protein
MPRNKIRIRSVKTGKGYKKDLNEDGFVGENFKQTAITKGGKGVSRTVEKTDLSAEGVDKKIKRVTYSKKKTDDSGSSWADTKEKIVIRPKDGKRRVVKTKTKNPFASRVVSKTKRK